jgi:hypothetical protein
VLLRGPGAGPHRLLIKIVACSTIRTPSARGAQTSRPDDAGPVRRLLGGMASPAAFLCFHNKESKRPIPQNARSKKAQATSLMIAVARLVAAYAPAAAAYVRRTLSLLGTSPNGRAPRHTGRKMCVAQSVCGAHCGLGLITRCSGGHRNPVGLWGLLTCRLFVWPGRSFDSFCRFANAPMFEQIPGSISTAFSA